MKRKLAVTLAVALAALAVILVPTGGATTQPAIQITIKVTVTDAKISMSQYTARRGWGAHFVIRNLGTKPYTVDIGGLVSKVIAPGKRDVIKASLDERGKYPFKVIPNRASAKHSGVFRVV